MTRVTSLALVLVAAALLTTTRPSQAAPQILAALEVQEGMPFICDGATCETDITTFCLQQDRESPRTGTLYAPADPSQFRLRVTTAGGAVRDIPAANATFTSGRGFIRVRVSLPADRLATLGGAEARLVVTRQASLIPAPRPDDPDPITPAEAEYVTKSLRAVGEELVDGQPRATSARIVGRVASAITDYRAASSPAAVERLWNDVLDDMAPVLERAGATAVQGARREVDRCARPGHHHSLAGVKSCLEYRHGDLMRDLNVDYWNRKPGS
ncbi:MAG: hypothetical protein COW30_10370 [Rhodospirillales bacterium CG15_BIG_FIL_POST_REV_8_21_14_020_66_15]|nr:MAG: hypothetical protein COW30_10370 [Rhodospirillales bacterium CG15_BIG_FIL_POST_REV_8_21_14_020_66_15]